MDRRQANLNSKSIIMATILIENLKCGGCANTIKKNIIGIDGVDTVDVNVETSEVKVEMKDEGLLSIVKDKLSKLGYPEVGESNSVLKKAKSFVSCAVGRMSSEEN